MRNRGAMLLEVLVALAVIALALFPLLAGIARLLERLDTDIERTRLRIELLQLRGALKLEVDDGVWRAAIDDVGVRVLADTGGTTDPQAGRGRHGDSPGFQWRLRAVPGAEVDRIVIEAWTERVRVTRSVLAVRL